MERLLYGFYLGRTKKAYIIIEPDVECAIVCSHTFKFTHNNNIIMLKISYEVHPHKSEKNSKSLLAFLPPSNRVTSNEYHHN